VAVSWSAQGVPVDGQSGVDVFVDYPASDSDNHAAGLVMHEDVGKWVALGGGAYHLAEACRRLQALSRTPAPARGRAARAGDSAAGTRVLEGFADLLPDRNKLAKLYPGLSADADAAAWAARGRSTVAAPAVRSRAKRATKARGRTRRKR
jgi:hypothetical protein